LDGELATLARLSVSPAPASTGTTLYVNVAAALDGNSADADLDPHLSLVEARVAGEPIVLSGLSGALALEFNGPVDVELVARRGPETTVLFDVEAEPIR
jgi:hypothetical protein